MDKDTFTAQVLSAEKQLYATAKSILQNEQDCADAVQSAILLSYAKLSTLRSEEYFRTWLVRILINECFRIRRKKLREIPYDPQERYREASDDGDDGSYGEDTVWEQAENSQVYECLMELKESLRLPVVLHYMEGYSVKETAKILKISENTVKQRLLRGRRKMREMLDGTDESFHKLRRKSYLA